MADLVHVNSLVSGAKDLHEYSILAFPGGFSYGDDIASGKVFANELRCKLGEDLNKFIEEGKLIIGICNGFQILLEAGLLPGAMLRNQSLQFRCHYTHLRVENAGTPFTRHCRPGQVLRLPIAHAEGNYTAPPETLAELEREGRVVLRYVDEAGEPTAAANPNGSAANIAGIVNRGGNVFGLMPHPERCAEEVLGSTDGRFIFDSIVAHVRERAGKAAIGGGPR